MLFRRYAAVFLMSMVPVAELRASIPAGFAMGLNPILVVLLSIVGNLLPVPFVMLFIRRILNWLKTKPGIFCRFALWLERKARKGAKKFYKYELLGLTLLVAIPLPGTGAWTGALVAAMLNLRLKTSVPAIGFGVCIAAAIVTALSFGVSTVLGT